MNNIYKGNNHLGDYFSSSREKGVEGLPLLSVTLHNGLIHRGDLDRRTETNIEANGHLLVRQGDIAYNMMRIWQGALGRASFDGIVSPAYVVLRPNKDIDSKFSEYLFNTPRIIYLFWAYSYGLTKDRLRLYFNDFKRIPIEILPLSEQKKIANILSIWDRAIEVTEKLISNSQQQKKFLLQQLLTGKKRLPNFSGAWANVKFENVLDIVIGGTPSRSKPEYWDDQKITQNRWLSIRNLKGNKIIDTSEYISDLGVKNSNVTLIPAGTIVMSFKLTIGRCAFLGVDSYTNEAISALIIKKPDEIDNDYLFYALAVVDFDKEIDPAIKGKTLNKAKLKRLLLSLPEFEEQQKIASVLSAADKEIEALQQKLDFLKQEKKALMQQLLTGKRRVTIDDIDLQGAVA